MLPLGVGNFHAASRRSLFSSQKIGLPTGGMWIYINRISGSNGFPSPGKMSRLSEFTKWAEEHKTYPATPHPFTLKSHLFKIFNKPKAITSNNQWWRLGQSTV